jgi:hypothetical protein
MNVMPKKFLTLSLFLTLTAHAWAADVTAPTTTATLDPTAPDGNNGWYVSPVTIELSATDLESGVASINYSLNGNPWQTVNFESTLNLAPNPSFENPDGSSNINTEGWEALNPDTGATYLRDNTEYLAGYADTSINVVSTDVGWHYISNIGTYAVTAPLNNMAASVWVKTNSVTQTAYFKVYAMLDDFSTTQLATSNTVTGTTDWTQLTSNFIVTPANAIGVYLEIGLEGTGTIWMDSVSLTDSLTSTTTDIVIGGDGEHTLEYYSIDRAGNNEAHGCPATNCISLKIDQTPPGNWHDSGAFRGLFGAEHEVYVYTNVSDTTSGLSVFTDKYQYTIDHETGYGRYQYITLCNSGWLENEWALLISPPFTPGVQDAFLLTPKTDFCNSNWKICKVVRFHAEDMAGNVAEKDFCINGPWIRFEGEGIVRSNYTIDMIAEPDGDNTDGLIETWINVINFFTSSKSWEVIGTPAPETSTYTQMWESMADTPTLQTELNTTSGVYLMQGDFEMRNNTIPNTYDNDTFSQIWFIDGDLTITADVDMDNSSAALFVVSGDVNIEKNVDYLGIAVISDGVLDNASDVEEGQSTGTLEWHGFYSANKFVLKRTLQGTNNAHTPSDEIFFEPKYLVKLRDFFIGSQNRWLSTD